ncbi:MAG: hypothetical protein AAGJ08_01010 [Cyanobacteria bacterium P01_H01_bin.35]
MNITSIIAKQSDIAAAVAPRKLCEPKRNRCSIATFMQQSHPKVQLRAEL